MSAIKLRIQVEEIDNVLTQYDEIKVHYSTTEEGSYSEVTGPGTRITLVEATSLYEYIHATGDPTYWYKFSYYNSTTTAESSLSDPIQGQGLLGRYCTVEDIRDEGFPESQYPDSRVIAKIDQASRKIERLTRKFFEPRLRFFIVDSDDTQILELPLPIIRLDALYLVSGRADTYSESAIELSGVMVYNRHLTQGLEEPDDREFPHIAYPKDTRVWRHSSIGGYWTSWPNGYQKVKVDGLWGWTELDPNSSPAETSPGSQVPVLYGETPVDIVEACIKLTIKSLPLLSDIDAIEDARNRFRITSEKTREQSYTMTPLTALNMFGSVTGDPEIDELLVPFMPLPEVEVA